MFNMYFVKQIDNFRELESAMRVRRRVFVDEQGVPAHEEYDRYDWGSFHYLAVDERNRPCGAARWRITEEGTKLERFAVDAFHRNHGVGSALVRKVLEDVARYPDAATLPLYLHAQLPAVSLYEKFGFRTEGGIFQECSIDHYLMKKADPSIPADAPADLGNT